MSFFCVSIQHFKLFLASTDTEILIASVMLNENTGGRTELICLVLNGA